MLNCFQAFGSKIRHLHLMQAQLKEDHEEAKRKWRERLQKRENKSAGMPRMRTRTTRRRESRISSKKNDMVRNSRSSSRENGILKRNDRGARAQENSSAESNTPVSITGTKKSGERGRKKVTFGPSG